MTVSVRGEQDSRPAHGKKRPDQFHPHRGGGSQHRSQQKHRLPDKAVGAGRQKAAEQPILHLCKKGGEEEQHPEDGALHPIFHPAHPAGGQTSDAVRDGPCLKHDAQGGRHHQCGQRPMGKPVKIQPQDSPPKGSVMQIPTASSRSLQAI